MISFDDAKFKASRELKNSYFSEQYDKGEFYGYLSFGLNSKEVKFDGREAYYFSVVSGEWGSTVIEDIQKGDVLLKKGCMSDGIFDENCDIQCVVFKDDGEYKYLKKEDLSKIEILG